MPTELLVAITALASGAVLKALDWLIQRPKIQAEVTVTDRQVSLQERKLIFEAAEQIRGEQRSEIEDLRAQVEELREHLADERTAREQLERDIAIERTARSAEVDDLRKRVADLEAENTDLRQILAEHQIDPPAPRRRSRGNSR